MAVVLALTASLAWGVSDFLGGIKSRTLALLTVLLVSQAVGALVMCAIVLFHGEPPHGRAWLIYAVLAAIAGTIGLAALYGGMAIGLITLVAPVAATAPILPVLVGLLTGERPRTIQLLGAALALGGVVMLSMRPGAAQSDVVRRRGAGIGVALAVLASVSFGCFYLGLAAASKSDALWATLVQRAASVGLLGAAALLLRHRPEFRRVDLPALASIGVLDVGANVLYATASTVGSIALTPVLASSLYPIEAVVLARLFLRERIARLQQIAVLVVIAGVALVSA